MNQNMLFPRRLLSFGALTLSVFLMFSCSKKINFSQSIIVPSASGSVKIKTDKNKNYVLRLHVINMARPNNLPIPANSYVVWMESSDFQSKNLGQLKISNNFIQKVLKGSLQAVTSSKPTRIFITAENDAAASYPTGQVILTTPSF